MSTQSSDPIDQQVHDLLARLDSPSVPIDADLARGRRRLRRRQGLAALGAAAVVAAAVPLGVGLASGPDASRSDLDPADRIGERLGLEDARELPRSDALPVGTEVLDEPAMDPVKQAVRQSMVDALDPSGTHIPPDSVQDWDDYQTGGFGGYRDLADFVATSFSYSFDWQGPDGLRKDAVVVDVGSGTLVDCGGSWKSAVSCTPGTLAGLPVLEVPDYDGMNGARDSRAYVYERADGYQVLVSHHDSVEIDDARLRAVLTDPAVDIPGHPAPLRYEPLAGTVSRDVGRDVLGSRIRGREEWSGDLDGYYYAQLAGAGAIHVQHLPAAGGLSYPCSGGSGTARCLEGTWEGRRIRIDYQSTSEDATGGYRMTYEGPRRTTEIMVDADDRPSQRLPEELALRVVTDPRLQE